MEHAPEEEKHFTHLRVKLNLLINQIEKLENYLDGLNVDAINAKVRLDRLTSYYENAGKYNDKICAKYPDDPLVNEFERIESRYFELASAIEKLKQSAPLLSSTANSGNITITERQELPRLPKIRIPIFDGKRENWANYKNKFIALVHSRSDISDAIKCSQLFDSLTDKALAKVSQFDPSEKDYPKAWQTLLDFYDHKRMVAVEHLHAILDLPQVQKMSADELSALIDQARQHLHILEGLDVQVNDDLVVCIIERCLPPVLRSRWQDTLEMDTLPKLNDLFKFIQNAIFKQQAFEHSAASSRNQINKKRVGENLSQSSHKVPKRSNTFTTSATVETPAAFSKCPSCNESHRLYKCPTFNGLSTQDRWNLIRKVKACQNCLWIHQFPCKSNQRCKRCNRNHHTLLHNERGSQQQKTPEPSSSNIGHQ